MTGPGEADEGDVAEQSAELPVVPLDDDVVPATADADLPLEADELDHAESQRLVEYDDDREH